MSHRNRPTNEPNHPSHRAKDEMEKFELANGKDVFQGARYGRDYESIPAFLPVEGKISFAPFLGSYNRIFWINTALVISRVQFSPRESSTMFPFEEMDE